MNEIGDIHKPLEKNPQVIVPYALGDIIDNNGTVGVTIIHGRQALIVATVPVFIECC